MSTASPILFSSRPWLLATAGCALLPHVPHQPYWLSGLLCLLIGWSVWILDRRGELPARWQLVLMVIIGTTGTFAEYRTLFGREAGVSLLTLFMAMKLLESRTRRDVMVIIGLAYFLLLTQFFYSQTMLSAVWLIVSAVIINATLIRQQTGDVMNPRQLVRKASTLVGQAIPFMVLLFFLFPRINGPLWGLPSDANSARSGLSEEMSPGSISNLVQSSEIAFRIKFDGPTPPKSRLYWRGPVLENHDGLTWRSSVNTKGSPNIESLGPVINYETTLEPNQQRWLFALDAPVGDRQAVYSLNRMMSVQHAERITQRKRIRLQSTTAYRFNADESQAVRSANLDIPPGMHPQTRSLGRKWQLERSSPTDIVARALDLFTREPFAYTLRPPLLGNQPVDEFLFGTKRGFCEHYAAAFVILMRSAGVPARVVTGYQGGEVNQVDGYLIVRQSDAHAWAEVWIENQGWIRVDPTSMVSPARVEGGLATALPEAEGIPALIQLKTDWMRMALHRWEALNNAWNQYVLGYTQQRQRDFLEELGLDGTDWQMLAILLGASSGTALLVLTLMLLRHRDAKDPAVEQWEKALAWARRREVHFEPSDTPLSILRHLETKHPEHAEQFARIVDAYLKVRYGNQTNEMASLKLAVQQLTIRKSDP